jgi:hypothetical protein
MQSQIQFIKSLLQLLINIIWICRANRQKSRSSGKQESSDSESHKSESEEDEDSEAKLLPSKKETKRRKR